MKYKFSFALASFLTGLVPIMTSGAQVSSLYGTAPVTTIVSVDTTFTNDFDCAFPLVEQVGGSYRDTVYFDQSGVVVREYISRNFREH